MARLGAAYNIGFILGPFVGGLLAKAVARDRRLPDSAACGVGPAPAARPSASLLVVAKAAPPPTDARRNRSRWVMFGFAARHPVIGRLMLLTFFVGFAFTGIESTFGLWAQHRFGWQPREVGLCFGDHRRGLGLRPVLPDRRPLAALRRGAHAGARHGRDGDLHRPAAVLRRRLVTVGLMALMALVSSVAFPNSGALLSRASTRTTRARSWA